MTTTTVPGITGIHTGDVIHVRRWRQPHLDRPDGRELAGEYTGTVKDVHDGLIWMGEAPGGFFCPGYVFLGGSPQDGTCMYLVTEIEHVKRATAGRPAQRRCGICDGELDDPCSACEGAGTPAGCPGCGGRGVVTPAHCCVCGGTPSCYCREPGRRPAPGVPYPKAAA